jgi:hypothetical protein
MGEDNEQVNTSAQEHGLVLEEDRLCAEEQSHLPVPLRVCFGTGEAIEERGNYESSNQDIFDHRASGLV